MKAFENGNFVEEDEGRSFSPSDYFTASSAGRQQLEASRYVRNEVLDVFSPQSGGKSENISPMLGSSFNAKLPSIPDTN